MTAPTTSQQAASQRWVVRELQSEQLGEVVDVHMRAFPSFFLSFLGPRFLRVFYGSFVSDPTGIGVVAEENGHVLGVAVGPQYPQSYFRKLLKRRWLAFCTASLGAILRRPSVVIRLYQAIFYRGESPTGPPRALLSSLAVAPETQGRGIGAALVRAWVEQAKARGCNGAYLTTDADDNDPVNAFYQRLGWVLQASYTTPQGRRMNRYVLDFPTAGGDSTSAEV